MPVVDLADYLGMPQQAPADPLFYQNQRNASIDREIADFNQRVGARDQLSRLQRQTPVLQAQQAQNAYDEVAQQARDLRMKQEIEAQVERAASELAGGNLNPESDDFAVKYRDLATRNPLAMSDPRFRQVAGLYENQFQNYQQAKAQQMEAEARAAAAQNQYRRNAIAKGVPAADIPANATEMDIASLIAKVPKPGRGGTQDASLQMMQKDYELVGSRLKAMEDEGKSVLFDKDGVEIPNPKFEELAKEHDRLFNELRGSYQGKYRPAESATATTQAAPPPTATANAGGQAVVPAPASFKDTMKGLATPKAEDILKVDESEVIRDINDPSADENTYVAAISDPNTSLEAKKQALAKLQQMAKSPPPRSDLTVGEAIRRRSELQALAEQAKQDVEAYPVVQQYNKAWSGIKSKMDQILDEFAKSISSSKDQVINSLKSGELIQGLPGYEVSDMDQGGVSVYRLLSDYFADKMGQERQPGMNRPGLGQTVDELEVFKSSPFAKKIGMLGPLGFGGSKTWSDVLDVYLAEKTKPVASTAPQVSVAPAASNPALKAALDKYAPK